MDPIARKNSELLALERLYATAEQDEQGRFRLLPWNPSDIRIGGRSAELMRSTPRRSKEFSGAGASVPDFALSQKYVWNGALGWGHLSRSTPSDL
jgi:hypothetical protein